MDYNPRDTLDRVAAGNRGRHHEMTKFHSGSLYPFPRRASSETRLEVLQNRDILGDLERREPEVEKESSKVERQNVEQSDDSVAMTRKDSSLESLSLDEEALKLEFDACIQEHQDTKLKIFPKFFKCLKSSHFYMQLVTYYISVLLVGVPATIVWGCMSGLTVFARVWIWVPALKLFLFWVHSCAPAILRPAQVLCIPFVDICARKYRQISVQAKLNGLGETPVAIKNV